jgi:hypothetical protein
MSERSGPIQFPTGAGKRRVLETCYVRDFHVPISAEDWSMESGYRCISIPPTDDPAWFIVDESHDKRTTWGRWHVVEGEA